MSELDPVPTSEEPTVSRRNVLRLGAAGAVAAWSVPVILTLQASPAGAASLPPSGSTSPQTQPSSPSESSTTATTGTRSTDTTEPGSTGSTEPGSTGSTQPLAPPLTDVGVKPEQVTIPPPTVTSTTTNVRVRAEEVTASPETTPDNGGLAFTGAEIGGLVVLGAGAVALGTAAVWSVRNRDDEDDSFPA
jgi:hypothetical protein